MLLHDVLHGQLPPRRVRPHRRLVMGQDADAAPVYLDPFAVLNQNTGIVGDTGSGKSWLAGLLAEELLKQGYQICVIDPEGDYRGLRAFPHTLLLGGPYQSLPRVDEVMTLSEYARLSLVLDLSACTMPERAEYVLELLHGLRGLRGRQGRPHWLLVDEAQNVCPHDGGAVTDVLSELMRDGGVGLVSYHPSRVAPELIGALSLWLLTRITVADELALVHDALAKLDANRPAINQLMTMPQGQAYLCGQTGCASNTHTLLTFRVAPRSVPHIRHLHKYLRLPLPSEKHFQFYDPSKGRFLGIAAATLWEFGNAVSRVPVATLRYHLARQDFEHWIRDALHDDELARQVSKLGRRSFDDDTLREAFQTLIVERYTELGSLV